MIDTARFLPTTTTAGAATTTTETTLLLLLLLLQRLSAKLALSDMSVGDHFGSTGVILNSTRDSYLVTRALSGNITCKPDTNAIVPPMYIQKWSATMTYL